MERIWRLFGHRQQDGYLYQQDKTVLYVHLSADGGLSDYYLYGASFLAQYAQVYMGSQAKSVVLFVVKFYSAIKQVNL